ncbi:MAG: hypothetical protein ACREOI_05870 [bacterium]
MSYDFFGRLKQKTTPDAQATYFYIYDKAGRMRFMMDANGGSQNPDHIQYWKYDALGCLHYRPRKHFLPAVSLTPLTLQKIYYYRLRAWPLCG